MGKPAEAVDGRAWLIALVVFGSATALSPWTREGVMLPKFTLVAIIAVLLVGSAIWSLGARRTLAVPLSWPALSVVCFMAAAVLATVTSALPWMSLFGAESRYSGLLSYLSYGVIFLAVMAGATRATARLWTRAALVAVVPCLVLGLAQAAGAEPLGYIDNGLPGAFSTFGNVNFAGAWSGMVAALLIATALDTSESRGWRIFAGAALPADLLYGYLTGTSQATVVAVAAVGFAGALMMWGVASADRRRFRRLLVVVGFSLATGLAALLMVNRSRISSALDQALVERPYFWTAAIQIWSDNPVLGTGLDTFGQFFLQYRTPNHAAVAGGGTADAPHSVPLAMLSNGGLFLAVTYATFVVAVGLVVLRGVRTSTTEMRPVLAGWGGVWVGYQVQSLVSFDVPPLAVLHVLSAGVIVGFFGRPRWAQVELPDLGRLPARPRGGSVQARSRARRRSALVGAGLCVAVLGWCALLPMRADSEAASALSLTTTGRLSEATTSFERAAELNPARAEYLALAAQSMAGEGRLEQAFALTTHAANREPGSVKYELFTARLAQELGRSDEAARWYRAATQTDPFRVDVLTEVASFFVDRGQDEMAERYLRRALEVDPEDEEATRLLAATSP